MLKTFVGKFTFFFWLSFFIINVPIYFFGLSYVQKILTSSEEEKIELMLHTLNPIIALNISFNQEQQLNDIFNHLLKHEFIDIVHLQLATGQMKNYIATNQSSTRKKFIFHETINDPFDNQEVAKLKIFYVNSHLERINKEIIFLFLYMFLFASVMFMMFFIFFIRKDVKSLAFIVTKLRSYVDSKTFEPIELKDASVELHTITDVLNDAVEKNVHYIEQLQRFNDELEDQVNIKVEELKKQEEMMIHQSRQAAMGEMLESIAHQWRQPLNVIGLSTAKLDIGYQLNTLEKKDFHEAIETISYNINYMSSTIDDFRNFIQPNKEAEFFSPKKAFEDVLNILGAKIKNNLIEYEVNCKDTIELYGVANEFTQVVIIMLNNSIDAIKSQKEKKIERDFKIKVSITQENENGIIEISDNGGGIPENIIHSIFQPYFTTKFAAQGTGIGLHIVKNVIEKRMYGVIHVKNIEDGCLFRFELPLKKHNKEIEK